MDHIDISPPISIFVFLFFLFHTDLDFVLVWDSIQKNKENVYEILFVYLTPHSNVFEFISFSFLAESET